MEPTAIQRKYEQLILTAESAGVAKLYVRELNNILYIDGHVPSETVKQELWELFNQIDPGYRSGDLVLNLQMLQKAG
jgi:prepilin-type processing-associated H-X9-DG protein